MELTMVLLGFAILGGLYAKRRGRHEFGLIALGGVIGLPLGAAAAFILTAL